jgi:hypothetical protein
MQHCHRLSNVQSPFSGGGCSGGNKPANQSEGASILVEPDGSGVHRGRGSCLIPATRRVFPFVADHRPRLALMVCNERSPRVHDGVGVLPWRDFLARLWGGQILA